MKRKILYVVLAICCLLVSFGTAACTGNQSNESVRPPEKTIYETFGDHEESRTEIPYDSVLDVPVLVTTYCALDEAQRKGKNSVVLYVINHAEERAGTESDVDIVTDLLKEYVVVVVDYLGSPFAVSPILEQSVMNYKTQIIAAGTYLNGISYDDTAVHVVPSGCRIVRDVVYFDLAASGAKGSLDYIVQVWNTAAVKKKVGSKWVQAQTVSDIPMKNGDKLDAKYEDGSYKYLTYRLDLIYPSRPQGEVPVIMLGSTAYYPNKSTGYTDHPERCQYIGFLMRGYAAACYDHEYIPFMAGATGWGHVNPDYSMCFLNGVKTHTAAVRCIKSLSESYGYSRDKVGVYGHSKAAWSSVLSRPSPETFPEETTYGEYVPGENYGPQPYRTYSDGTEISSEVVCVYHSMGFGSYRYEKILSPDNKPTLISCGLDEYGSWDSWADEWEAYRNSGIEYIAISMYEQGHTIAPYVKAAEYDYYYYDVFVAFFDYHLKGINPTFLYSSVSADGIQRSTENLFIQFSAPVTESSFLANVRLTDSSGATVNGSWRSEGKGNKWLFDIADLRTDSVYTLKISGNVADKNGKTILVGQEIRFQVAG